MSTASDGDGDTSFLLDVLFDHKMEWVQKWLRDKGLSAAGNKPELRSRVESGLEDETLEESDLIALLDQVEGWGNQHIYLYKAEKELINWLADADKFKEKLRALRKAKLFNGRVPLILPEEPALSAIEWSAQRVRFIWIEKRIYRDPRDDKSYIEDEIEYHAYEVKQSRGIISFACDLVTGLAELMIQRLPSGNNYPGEKAKYFEELKAIFDIEKLKPQRISRAILKADADKKIRKRSSSLGTPGGSGATFTSPSRKVDVYKEKKIRDARKALGTGVAGKLGNYYWPFPDRDVHVKLYAKDQRIGIFGECTEDEVKNVLSAVRKYS